MHGKWLTFDTFQGYLEIRCPRLQCELLQIVYIYTHQPDSKFVETSIVPGNTYETFNPQEVCDSTSNTGALHVLYCVWIIHSQYIAGEYTAMKVNGR